MLSQDISRITKMNSPHSVTVTTTENGVAQVFNKTHTTSQIKPSSSSTPSVQQTRFPAVLRTFLSFSKGSLKVMTSLIRSCLTLLSPRQNLVISQKVSLSTSTGSVVSQSIHSRTTQASGHSHESSEVTSSSPLRP